MLAELGAAVARVGEKILDCRARGQIQGTWRGTQFKAEADLIADDSLRSELRRIADIDIVSEEDVASQRPRRLPEYWLIDPIDGTASFAGGYSGFVCQAALVHDAQVQMSAVCAPAMHRLYLAQVGKGASLNSEPLRVRAGSEGDVVLVDNYPQPRGIAERLYRGLPCARYLESGSIGLKICLVADGTADLFVKDVAVRDWDVAAPALILTEAGGALRRFDNQEFLLDGDYEKTGLIAAASPRLLDAVAAFANPPRGTHDD